MMNSSRRNSGRARLLAAVLLAIFLFAFDFLSGGALRNALRGGAARGYQFGGGALERIVSSGFFSSRKGLAAQNRALREELAQFEERAAGFAVLKSENEQLRAFVHMAADMPGMTVPIVSSVRSSPYGTFLIGAGLGEGIERGNLVVTSGGFVVGEVSDVGPHTAVVIEVLAPGASVDAIIGGAATEVSGSGGGNGEARVPRGMSITVGEGVAAPRFQQRPIGIVGHVASTSVGATQDVFIRLPVNLASLQYVYVIPRSN